MVKFVEGLRSLGLKPRRVQAWLLGKSCLVLRSYCDAKLLEGRVYGLRSMVSFTV